MINVVVGVIGVNVIDVGTVRLRQVSNDLIQCMRQPQFFLSGEVGVQWILWKISSCQFIRMFLPH